MDGTKVPIEILSDVSERFRGELRRLLERCTRLAKGRDIRVRANQIDFVVRASTTREEILQFVAATPACYVHVTNLGRPSEVTRVRWADLRFPTFRRTLNTFLGL